MSDTIDVEFADLTDAELAEALLAADRERSVAEGRELALLAAFDARQVHGADGVVSAAVWLAQRGDVTRSAAGLLVSDARKLRRHPVSLAACGRVGTGRVREMIRRVTARTDAAYTETEPVILDSIGRFSVDDTIVFAKRWARLVDQNGPEPPENRSSMSMGRTGDGLFGSLALFGEDGALVENALNHEADQIYRSEGDDHQASAERRAQALVNLVRKALGADDTFTAPARPTVVVHITLDQLEHRVQGRVAEIDPMRTPISDAALRRLLCDAQLHRFVTDPNGVVLNLGRSERLVKGWQRLALIARDRHCQFPGCDRAPSMCHAHHIIPWEHGGPTDMANLLLLCHHHHHAVHEQGFTCERLPDGTLQFRKPDGTILEPQPRPG